MSDSSASNILDKFIPVDFDPFQNQSQVSFIQLESTEAQRELFTNIRFGGDIANLAYNESVTLFLKGTLQVDNLKNAIHSVCQHHDSLRTTFSADGMHMNIVPEINVEAKIIFADSEELEKNIDEQRSLEVQQVFNLEKGPLIRFVVISNKENEHALIITAHHIVCDGWSLGILMQDLSRWYSHYCDSSIHIPEPAVPFSDYVSFLNKHQTSEKGHADQKFWTEQYKDELPLLDLPTYKRRPAIRTYKANRVDHKVSDELYANLKSTARKWGVSFVSLLIASFECYMHRLIGTNDVIIALPSAGQSSSGLSRLIGHCVNLLPLRSKQDAGIKFSDYVQNRKSELFDAYEHQLFTLGTLMSHLKIKRDPARIPLTPISFNVDIGLTDDVEFFGLNMQWESNKRVAENFEFYINASGDQQHLILECSYNTSLFDDSIIETRLKEFTSLLEDVCTREDSIIDQLKVNTNDDLLRMTNEWNATSISYDRHVSLYEWFENTALKNRNEIAIHFGAFSYTYEHLLEQVEKYAARFQQLGLQKGNTAVLLLERSPEMIYALLAILKCGAVYVPVALSNPEDRINYILSQCKAKIIVTQKSCRHLVAQSQHSFCIEDIAGNAIFKPVDYSSEDSAYIIYTSGSTGKPKGVEVSNRSVVNYISWCLSYYLNDNIKGHFGLFSSLSFDLTVTSIFCPLLNGKSLTIFRQQAELLNILHDHFSNENPIDCIKLTPAHILVLDNLNISSNKIKTAIVGGEELLPTHIATLRKINPEINIYNEYGPTEATVGCVVKKIDTKDEWISIGKPISNTSCYILNEQLANVPLGASGELYLSGECLAKGYFENKTLSADRFVPDVNIPGAYMYKTGDIVAYLPNGDILYKGRNDEQVKIRGYRIEIGEVQAALQTLTSKDVVVCATEDDLKNQLLLAYIVDPADNTSIRLIEISEIDKSVFINESLTKTRTELLRLMDWLKLKDSSVLEIGVKERILNNTHSEHLIFNAKKDNDYHPIIPDKNFDLICIVFADLFIQNAIDFHQYLNQLINKLNEGGAIVIIGVPGVESINDIGYISFNPEYFYSFVKGHPNIAHVDVLSDLNHPGSRFHAIMYNEPLALSQQFINWSDFKSGEWNSKKMNDYLASDNIQTLGISSIPYHTQNELEQWKQDFEKKSKRFNCRFTLIDAGDAFDVVLYKGNERLHFRNRLQSGKYEYYMQYIQSRSEANSQSNEETELLNQLKKLLPEYMIPSGILSIPEIPLTPNGKLDKQSLPKLQSRKSRTNRFVPPSNQTEELIHNIWIAVLQDEDIGIHDNFFESGGHSLLAIKVISEIEKFSGKKFPATTLFTAPTIAELSAMVDQEEASQNFKMVLPLRSIGNRIPLFCIHMHNGNSHRWSRLLRYLNQDQPLYAIQPRALDPAQKPQSDIVEMATLYISEMKKVQAKGPYRLFGLCFGGMVAFEMAQQLHKQGEKVSFLGFVDNYVPSFHSSESGLKSKLNRFLSMSMDEKIQLAGKVKNVILSRSGLSSSAENKNQSEMEDIRVIHTRALQAYNPQSYNGKIYLFKTEEVYPDVNDEHLGWDAIASKGVEFVKIDGSSTDSVVSEESHIQKLCQSLNQYLD